MFFNEQKNSNYLVGHIQEYMDKYSLGLCSSDIIEYNRVNNSCGSSSPCFSSTPINNELFNNLNIDQVQSTSFGVSQARAITKRFINGNNNNQCCSPQSSIISTSPLSFHSFDTNDSINGSLYMNKAFNHKQFGNKKQLPIRSAAIDMSGIIENAKNVKSTKKLYCSFCKNNCESEDVYTSHLLKDALGKITCPVLKLHKCPICHETGEKAHTITYCKEYKKSKRFELLQNALDSICKE